MPRYFNNNNNNIPLLCCIVKHFFYIPPILVVCGALLARPEHLPSVCTYSCMGVGMCYVCKAYVHLYLAEYLQTPSEIT
jgi:hypothetical protein